MVQGNEFHFRTVSRVIRGSGAARLHVFCPTLGRRSILTFLASMKDELDNNDFVTIIFDGQESPS